MNITINRKSWHYRTMCFFYSFSFARGNVIEPWTLCSYFWRAVLSPFAVLGTAVIFAVIGYLALSPVWVAVLWLSEFPLTKDSIWAWAPLAFSLCGYFVMAVSALVFWASSRPRTSIGYLASEYIAAKKRRVCPLLDYED